MRFAKIWMEIAVATYAVVLLTSVVARGQSTKSMKVDTANTAAPAKQLKLQEGKGISVETSSNKTREESQSVAADTSDKKMDLKATKMAGDTTAKAAKAGYWTCTMHPQIHKAESGNCPICGMKLVFRKNNTADTAKTRSKDTTATMGADRSKMKM